MEGETSGALRTAARTGASRMSDYGRFHFSYLGCDFKSNTTGEILSKGDFWTKHNRLASSMPTRLDGDPLTPLGWVLVPYREKPKRYGSYL